MKIVSLNIRHGGGNRARKILAWLTAEAADFVLLSEWRQNAGGHVLNEALKSAGYATHPEARSADANGILVAAKQTFSAIRLSPPKSLKGEIAAIDLDGLRILCGYFPQLEAKRPFFEVFLREAASVHAPLLFIGDLNTGRNDVDIEAGAARFSCADQFLELTRGAGMTDLWRLSNGAKAREWSWRSQKNGFRIDHAFGNPALVSSASAINCRYDHSTREYGMTDHSGLIVEFIGDQPH